MAISFVTIEPPQPQDQDIRQQLAAGDYRNAFEQLVERYKEKVFRLCFSMARNETQAEDLTQDIFLRVWKALPGYHGAASPSTSPHLLLVAEYMGASIHPASPTGQLYRC